MKVLAFDCETTGLDPLKCSIIQFAAILYIDGQERWRFNSTMYPWPGSQIDDEAIEVHGIDRAKMDSYSDPVDVHLDFTTQLSEHINKYDKEDKAYPLAYSGGFDLSFLFKWFERCGDDYLGSFIHSKLLLDPLPLLRTLDYLGRLHGFKSYKLYDVCEVYMIPLNAHDALSDVRAAVEVWNLAVGQLATLPPDLVAYELINQTGVSNAVGNGAGTFGSGESKSREAGRQ